MPNIVCLIHDNYLTLERNQKRIGDVREIGGEPIIGLFTEGSVSCVYLSLNDIAIIQENWAIMKELNQELNKVIDILSPNHKLGA